MDAQQRGVGRGNAARRDRSMSIVGSPESDGWEMKVLGPTGFERSYTLAGNAGEHAPLVIANVLLRLVPRRTLGNGDRDVHARSAI
jgi:hypothetical protein